MAETEGKSFEDLEVYQLARAFRRRMYKLARQLSEEEKYNIRQQIFDASRSLSNNIAEGHGRFHHRDNQAFQRKALGSLNELMDDINICEDEGYFQPEHLADLREDGYRVRAALSGYVRYLNAEAKASGREQRPRQE